VVRLFELLGNYVGGNEVQRNFLIKAAIVAQKAGINGLYIYAPAEGKPLSQVTDPYHAMGFYQKLPSSPYNNTITPGGIAWRTVSNLLKNRRYDAATTAQLKLPSNIDGRVFYSAANSDYVCVLWAKTSGASETASAQYSFPAWFNIKTLTQINWENKQTKVTNTIRLTGSPVFIKL
jgi:hypothetical protein